ncbi:hypothetical protein Droror1_Dr00007860 [Drosera rotundifolia]
MILFHPPNSIPSSPYNNEVVHLSRRRFTVSLRYLERKSRRSRLRQRRRRRNRPPRNPIRYRSPPLLDGAARVVKLYSVKGFSLKADALRSRAASVNVDNDLVSSSSWLVVDDSLLCIFIGVVT